MENIDNFSIKCTGNYVSNIEIDESDVASSIEIMMNDNSFIEISSDHTQDCCEHVYADFGILEYVKKDIVEKHLSTIKFTGVPEMGFLIHFDEKKYFIPCYNYQSGYYSSDLSLVIKKNKSIETRLDITNLVESSDR